MTHLQTVRQKSEEMLAGMKAQLADVQRPEKYILCDGVDVKDEFIASLQHRIAQLEDLLR
jgi:hypothetical protein